MDFDSKNYIKLIDKYRNRENERQLIRGILSAIHNNKYEIVLDVGCGGGQLTSLLDSEITVGHIYGLDISEDMIAFAKQNHLKDNISYIRQDFGAEFDCLASEVKALEGKVSLIFSHYAFNLIRDVKNLCTNLYRMLSKGGEVFATVKLIPDPYMDLKPEEKAIHEKEFLKIPDSLIQIKEFMNAFNEIGFDVISHENIESKSILTLNDFKEILVAVNVSLYGKYMVPRNEEMIKLKCNELKQKIIASYRPVIDVDTGDEMVESVSKYTLFRLKRN